MRKFFSLVVVSMIVISSYAQNPEISILFIGNSLTNGNSTNIDDPTTGHSIAYNFRGLAMAAGFNVHVEMYAPNGVYIYDDPNNSNNIGHCNRTITENLINSRQWDYVFVQDNVGSYMWSDGYLSADVGNSNVALHDKIIANNPCTKEIFYSAQGFYDGLPSQYWHSGGLDLSYDDNIQATIRSYRNSLYLNNVGGFEIVTPAGLAWNRYCNDGHSKDDLYYDTAHPTEKGAYLSGAVVFCSVFKMDPTDINWDNGFSDGQYLRQIAYETVMDNTVYTETRLDVFTPELSYNANEISVDNTFNAYQWYLTPNQIPGANAQSYIINQTGLYFAEVTDANGCKLRSKVTNYDYVTGVGSVDDSKILVFPNPALNNINLTGIDINSKIIITDVNGKIIISETANSNTHTINISNLNQGTYFVKVINENNVLVKKIIKE